MSGQIKSYASVDRWAFVRDGVRLLRGTRGAQAQIGEHVARTITAVREGEKFVADRFGMTLENRDALEIGVGQLPRQMACFALRNRVTGIDLDVAPQGLDIPAYWTMLRRNGPLRVTKTIVRKAMGFDRSFRREMARQLGVAKLPPTRALPMDASRMDFPDGSFDFIYSFDVFEHLPEPGPILRDCARVLRPGGVFYTSLHPITTEDGFHDLRIIAGQRDGIAYWAHLRPELKHTVAASSYLNEIRVADWRKTIDREMPGATVELTVPENIEQLRRELADIRKTKGLADFTDDELLCRRLVVGWKKPA